MSGSMGGPPDIARLEARARALRATAVQMAHDSREGHLGGSLSCIDLLVALYSGWLKADPEEPKRRDRDRLIFSKGHAATALYAVLADRGFFPKAWLRRYAQEDAPLPNHPCVHALPVLECSSGSLGQGLGIGTGMAYGMRLAGIEARVVVLMSDGECNEGSVWEAAMFAAANRLERVLAIVDNNGVQAVGRSDELMGHTSLEEKFRAFGWGARTIQGNRLAEILGALADVPFEPGRPSALVARTTGGAGVSFMQDDVLWHYRAPSDDDLRRALDELLARPIHKD
ncbi:MAG TPA: transketolase [Candidatus Methylomirabilis sp.]|nr:transketolase [Candidatus Methylomirabilis sp.]